MLVFCFYLVEFDREVELHLFFNYYQRHETDIYEKSQDYHHDNLGTNIG
nr:MAG TPA: hypothetical protein [Crassvirales sp.]